MEPKDGALGKGWRFPIQASHRGGVAMVSGEEAVHQSIRIILSTAKGERVMRPDFGCDIHEFVFETTDRTTCTMIESSVREALVQWEPRIEVQSVRVTADETAGRLRIALNYRIRETNSEFNAVYPFHVGGGG